MENTNKRWVKACLIAGFIVLLDVIVLLLGTLQIFHITWSVGSIGIISFFGIMMLVNHLSRSEAFDKGEWRKAIAGSFILMYFSVLTLLSFEDMEVQTSELSKVIIEHFTYLIGIIIVFYFGSSSVREYMRLKN